MPIHPLLYYAALAEKYKAQIFKGEGLFRTWQNNPEINSYCWVITPDFEIKKIKVEPKNPEFKRAYKTFCTYDSEIEAKNTLALIFNILQKRQFDLYKNGADISDCIFKDFFQEELFS